MIKELILHVTIINIYQPNNRTPKIHGERQTELNEKTNCSTIIGGEFNTPLSKMGRKIR